jgi:hypothetical protein
LKVVGMYQDRLGELGDVEDLRGGGGCHCRLSGDSVDVLGDLDSGLIKWIELVEEDEEEERIHRGRDKYLSKTGGQKKIDGLQKIDDHSDEGLGASNPAFGDVLPMVSL